MEHPGIQPIAWAKSKRGAVHALCSFFMIGYTRSRIGVHEGKEGLSG
jgi:hypothetical protein